MGSLKLGKGRPAGIQYIGLAGVSQSCQRAIERLLLAGEQISKATLLTAGQTHAFLLEINPDEVLGVKTGFASGYPGEGPRTLSSTLEILQAFGVDIEEVEVSVSLLDRLDESALTIDDLATVEHAKPVRPRRWGEYLLVHGQATDSPPVISKLREVMPWGLLDERLVAIAQSFNRDPDGAVLTAFRRLEDIVRARLPAQVSEGRVFATAFSGERSWLTWAGLSAGEHNARGQLFTGAYGAFRNPRAHSFNLVSASRPLQEFLLLNLLFSLERLALQRQDVDGKQDLAQGS